MEVTPAVTVEVVGVTLVLAPADVSAEEIVATEAGVLRIPGGEYACHLPGQFRVCLQMPYHAFPEVVPHPSVVLIRADNPEKSKLRPYGFVLR